MFFFNLICKGLWTSLPMPLVLLITTGYYMAWICWWERLFYIWEEGTVLQTGTVLFLSNYLFKKSVNLPLNKQNKPPNQATALNFPKNCQRFVAKPSVVPWTRLDTLPPGRAWMVILFWGNNEWVSRVLDPSQSACLGSGIPLHICIIYLNNTMVLFSGLHR